MRDPSQISYTILSDTVIDGSPDVPFVIFLGIWGALVGANGRHTFALMPIIGVQVLRFAYII